MGLFGKSKEDTSQDKQINKLWEWINFLEKERKIHIEWINHFKKRDDLFAKCITQLQQKDKAHDAKDVEHDNQIQSIKNLAKAVEQPEVKKE